MTNNTNTAPNTPANIIYRTTRVPLFPKQYEFLRDPKRENMYVGGIGAGKSVALCWALFIESSRPNNECILMRRTLKSLKSTTLPLLLSGANPILPRGGYVLNKGDMTIKINGGGIIYVLGLENVETIRSINAGGIFLDEAIEFDEEQYTELMMRLRNPNGTRRMWAVTNPSTPSHFLYKRFFTDTYKRLQKRKVVTAPSYENTLLPQDYLDDFNNLDDVTRKRMVEGQWLQRSGLVYPNFDRKVHVRKLEKTGYESYYFAIDYGQTHPSGLLLAGVSKGRVYILEEFCESDCSMTTLREKIKSVHERYPNCTLLYDPSAKVIANDLSQIGIFLKKANNDVPVGINRVRTNLNSIDGEPGILVDESCVNLIREFESYQYKAQSEAVLKINDDLCDCARYILNEIEDDKGSYIYPRMDHTDNESREDKADRIEKLKLYNQKSDTEAFLDELGVEGLQMPNEDFTDYK